MKSYKILATDKKLDLIYLLLGIFTLGIFFLIAYWFKEVYYKFFRVEVDIHKADYILFTRNDNHKILSKIEHQVCRMSPFEAAENRTFVKFEG